MARSRHFFCVIWGPSQHWDPGCYSKHLGCLEKMRLPEFLFISGSKNPKFSFCPHLFSKSTDFWVGIFLLRLFPWVFRTWNWGSSQNLESTNHGVQRCTQIERWNWAWYLFRWSRSQPLHFGWLGVAGLRFLGFPIRPTIHRVPGLFWRLLNVRFVFLDSLRWLVGIYFMKNQSTRGQCLVASIAMGALGWVTVALLLILWQLGALHTLQWSWVVQIWLKASFARFVEWGEGGFLFCW